MGHKRTIRPNAKKLSALFLQREKMGWTSFSKKVKSAQRGFMGEPDEMKPGRGDFHEYPTSCICNNPNQSQLIHHPQTQSQALNTTATTHTVMSRDGDASSSSSSSSSSLEQEKEDDDFLAGH